MGQFKDEAFVCHDSIDNLFMSGVIRMCGEISCVGDIVIRVDKLLDVLDGDDQNPLVQTCTYAYNASVRGSGCFLRHDNAHTHVGHPDNHHRHEFDWRTGEAIRNPEWCGEQGWPTLGDFIGYVRDWYWSHRDELPQPDACASLGLRAQDAQPTKPVSGGWSQTGA